MNPAPDILAHFSQAGLHALPRPEYAHSTNLVDHRLLAAVVDALRRLHGHSLEWQEGEGVFDHQSDQPLGVEDEFISGGVPEIR